MKNNIPHSSMVFIAILLFGCNAENYNYVKDKIESGIIGNGNINTETRETLPFNQILLLIPAEAEVLCGRNLQIEIKGDENILPIITTEVKDGQLIVDADTSFTVDDKIKLIIEVQHLSALSVPGTCDMTVKNPKNESFTATLSGVGSLKLSGNTANFKCTVSGAGLVNARELIANHTDITLSGAGSAEVYASQSLNVTISGVGNVSYYGDPESVTKNIAGLGRVKKK